MKWCCHEQILRAIILRKGNTRQVNFIFMSASYWGHFPNWAMEKWRKIQSNSMLGKQTDIRRSGAAEVFEIYEPDDWEGETSVEQEIQKSARSCYWFFCEILSCICTGCGTMGSERDLNKSQTKILEVSLC